PQYGSGTGNATGTGGNTGNTGNDTDSDTSSDTTASGTDTGTGISIGTNYILGGPTLVQDIPGYTRIYGADRYATNLALRQTLSFNNEAIYTADGNTLVDALTGSVLAAKTHSAIVLTPNNDPTGTDFGNITPETKAYGFGGAK
ncbi:MAG: cell wall-binding repeat-containing protein, partial [Peptococcaceae bacterium]|nr:cell wall-binding repeat-containing protein [Peptococcaceae bacterium]